ncbi:MAG: hypothetical protein AB8H86_10045 [Polyangiales bacterium]
MKALSTLRAQLIFGGIIMLAGCAAPLETTLGRAISRYNDVTRSSSCDWRYYQVTSTPDDTWLEPRLTPEQVEHLVAHRQLWLAACVAPGTPFDARMLRYGGPSAMLAISCVAGPESCGVVASAPQMDICIMNY